MPRTPIMLIDRGRTGRSPGAIDRILSMADRMGAIAAPAHLWPPPGQRSCTGRLAEAVEAAREIAGPRLRQAGADLTVDLPRPAAFVRAGPVRMQQVLVNLLTNAADAVSGS
jgi:two-component system, NtrC family, C4-dicarboxylate transport sensor histidine kinase DctB